MKNALCVGINNYAGTVNDLNGCVNDANDWKQLLTEYGFKVELVLDFEATRKKILATLEKKLLESQPGDVVVFTYSGHGTQVADTSGDEEDYYDEALYVYDGVLLDDELRAVLDKAPEGVTVNVILDSCFSGTATRLLNYYNATPRYIKMQDIPWNAKPRKRFLKEEEMKELLLTGSSDDEYSYDAYIEGRYNGAMSYYAIREIRKNKEQAWENFYKNLRLALPSSPFPQTPQLEGKQELKKRALFKGKEVVAPPVEPPVEEEEPVIVIVISGTTLLLLLLYILLQGLPE